MVDYLRLNSCNKSMIIYKYLSKYISTLNKQYYLNILKNHLDANLYNLIKVSEFPMFDELSRCSYFYVEILKYKIILP